MAGGAAPREACMNRPTLPYQPGWSIRRAPAPHRVALKLAGSSMAVGRGGAGEGGVRLVFVRDDITGKNLEDADSARLDVKGKAVLFVDKSPEQAEADGRFGGNAMFQHATYMGK